MSIFVKIWGARGSIGGSVKGCEKYGGHTSCVEVRCGERVLIFDAGSGIRLLGNELLKESINNIDLFFGHCHHDHICGLPFFAPFHFETINTNIWSGHLEGKNKTYKMCADYMNAPFFPVGPEVFKGKPNYKDFAAGDILDIGDNITIKTMSLEHHGGCIGYRVEYGAKSFCYITDVTHKVGEPNLALIKFITNSELVIYDGTFADEEFEKYADFGHSTWQEGIRLCEKAGVKNYCIFHHRPFRTDAQLDEIVEKAKKLFPNTKAAYEGLIYNL